MCGSALLQMLEVTGSFGAGHLSDHWGSKGLLLFVKNFNNDNVSASGLTGFIIENMGPLETFLDVLLLYEYFLRTILS